MPNVRIGSAVVDLTLNSAKFHKAVDRVQRQAETMGAKMRDAATKSRSLTTALASVASVGFVSKEIFAIGAAVEETASKFTTVFGPATEDVQRFVDTFGTMAGLSNQAAQEVLGTTGAIVQGMGFAREASAAFSVEIVKLAGDLSSFNNVPIEETSLAIQAALTGEREQLKRLGIVLREADVQQRALAISGKDSASALTQQEKAAATLQLITERAGVAVGDLARTQDSAANTARRVAAEVNNIKEQIATALLPVISVAVEGFGAFIKGLQIMAAEAAVLTARMNFWKEAAFGTEESTMAANDQLRLMKQAAEEVKNEVIGLTFEVGAFSDTATNMATVIADTGNALEIHNVPFREYALTLPTVTGDVQVYASAQQAAAVATNANADAQNRLNDELSKGSRLLGGFGRLGSILGFSIPGIGQLAGLFGVAQTFAGVFDAGGTIGTGQVGLVGEHGPELVRGPAVVTSRAETARQMGGELTLTLLLDLGDGTVRRIRKRIRQLDNLQVPVTI